MSDQVRTSGWVTTTVREIADLVRGITYNKEQASKIPSSDFKPVLRANNINGALNFDDLVFVPQHLINSEQIIRAGDIIFAMSSGSKHLVGKSARARCDFDGSYGAFCGLLRAHKYMDKDFLYYIFQNNKFRRLISEVAKGSNINNLKREHILDFEIVLPPLPEQHRIVTKIEELFSELDKGIENLKTAQAQLKVYRQALLKHAFEGKLTAQWRAENQDKRESADTLLKRIQQERAQRYQHQLSQWEASGKQGSKPKAPKSLPPLTAEELAELPEMPEGWGWEWEKLGNIADLIGGVTKGKNLEGKKTLSLPYLRVANVQDGYLDLTEIKNIEVEIQDKDKYRLEFGDVLYTEGGDKDKLGRGAVWRGQIESCIHQNHIFRARVLGGVISSEILSLYSQTKSAKKYFFRHAKQTTNLASINLTVLANLPVAIVCQSEQNQILLEIESRLSEVDQLDQTITTALQQAEALRQSILKKAFSGQLVLQDPNDEPASELLARIKAKRVGNKTIIKH